MKLEETIQMCFDKNYASFENREQALLHIFCLFGNGFEWENGELINKVDRWHEFDGELDENGKAIQRISFEEAVLKFVYDKALEQGENPVPYDVYMDRMMYAKKAGEENGIYYLEFLLGDTVDAINELRSGHKKLLKNRMSKTYSHIFNIPIDIKDDWAKGLEETKEILKEMNFDLNKIR